MPTTRAPRKHSPKSSSHKKTSPAHHLQAATQHAQRTPAVPPRTRRNPMCNVAHYTTHPPELSAQKPPITCTHPPFHTRHSPPPARSGHAAHTPPSHHCSAHRLTQPLRVAHVAARPGPGCCGTGADGALGECDMGRWGRGVGGVRRGGRRDGRGLWTAGCGRGNGARHVCVAGLGAREVWWSVGGRLCSLRSGQRRVQ